MVYVISKDGKTLMPTKRHGKVRRLLKQGLAKVVRRDPFTIQLLCMTQRHTHNLLLSE
ncbi:RRXRR domain-containing protein [Thermosipho africanus]|uniref:RRXRR domain-containing protein n=1 Tax=Thermosipho africanus TaxID=2421 RepID=UPI00201165F5|nr:RRXRR domain-containing protein [Thermosipho africanus]